MAHWLLAAWTTTLLWFASAAGLEPVSVAGTGVPSGQGVDLLAALALHNSTRQGVSPAAGPRELRPAYYLQGDYRDLKLPPATFQQVVDLIRSSSEFTFAAWLRQEETNSGSIVSFSHGYNRYLELQSSGRKNEIRLHYTSQHDSIVHVETFPYRLADNTWHQLAVSVSGSQVELLVDCHPVYRRLLKLGAPDRNLTVPQLQLWVGQRNNRHSLFKGALQDVRVITGSHGYLAQCPHLDSSCPTCGQFSLLQNTVQELTRHLHELSERLVAAEGRIGKVEECDCQKSCHANGTAHGDGTTWQRDCDMCSCVHGEVQCRPVQCPSITCKNPVFNPGECCPSCLKQCYLQGTFYDHGEQVALKQCVECECKDGSMQCKRINPETMCPQLQCPPDYQFSVPGECCKFCPGVDYCAKGHMCHANATCLNLQTTYACHCDQGFHGDGHSCSDVDECKQQGGLDGHHCQSNTKCVNTPGSYVCECLPGYRRIDKFNCAELDECSTGEHGCDLHANCVNTQGSYHCVCKEGYTGDGYQCKPVCNQTCLNGGECVSPDKCSCRKGYIGPSCELDLDECASGLHRCHPASVCVNMPGWYYCKCKHGYRSILRDNTLGTLCQDIDECKESTHTCHHSARCINTEGSFRCTCTEDQAPDCKLSCLFEGAEVAHGMTVSPNDQPCRLCECDHGVITCRDPNCDCSVRGSERNKCCPQCDPNAVCTHQELRQVVFRSGERWIYQCQTCECLSGQVDCWDMDCPPLTCSDPVLTPGDCCPRCDDDPCSFDADDNATTSSGQPCTYAGRLYDSGTQWADPDDRCTSCNCKDGRLCCSFDFRCGDVGRPVGYDGVVAGAGLSQLQTAHHKTRQQQQQPQQQNTQQQQRHSAIGGKDTVPGHYSSGFVSVNVSNSKTMQNISNNTKQYSAAVRVDNGSSVVAGSPLSSTDTAPVVSVSDSEEQNKTEKETAVSSGSSSIATHSNINDASKQQQQQQQVLESNGTDISTGSAGHAEGNDRYSTSATTTTTATQQQQQQRGAG